MIENQATIDRLALLKALDSLLAKGHITKELYEDFYTVTLAYRKDEKIGRNT